MLTKRYFEALLSGLCMQLFYVANFYDLCSATQFGEGTIKSLLKTIRTAMILLPFCKKIITIVLGKLLITLVINRMHLRFAKEAINHKNRN